MGNIDRRILYLFAILIMVLPLFVRLPLPVAKNAHSLDLYQQIEKVDQSKGDNVILFCANFSPDTRGESLPQATAILRHLLISGKKFAIWTFNATSAPGQEMSNKAANEIAVQLDKQGIHRKEGTDWVNLGFVPATAPIMAGVSKDIPGFFKKDQEGTPINQIPFMKRVKSASDIGLVIDVSPSATYLVLIPAMTSKFNVPLVLAPTSVMVPDTYPFLMNGQVKGELRGVLGAAEYEDLLHAPDIGTREMTSVAALDAYIILLIIVGNISYFLSRKGRASS